MTTESDNESPMTPTGSLYSDGTAEHSLHPLDLTNFDGDDDTYMTGEAGLSHQLQKEGQLRRRESKRRTHLEKHTRSRTAQLSSSTLRPSHFSAHEWQDQTQNGEHKRGETSYRPDSGNQKRWSNTPSTCSTPTLVTESFSPDSPMDHKANNTFRTSTPTSAPLGPWFDDKDSEMQAMSVLSEMTRPGKPHLKAILSHEVERAQGSIGVACERNSVVERILMS